MNSLVGIATVSVAGFEAYTSEDVGLQAVTGTATGFSPGTRKGEGGRLLPRRRKSTLRDTVSEPLDIGELLDFAGASRQLVRLVEDRAAEYCAPFESDGRFTGVALF